MRILSRTTSIASLFLAVILSAPGFAASAFATTSDAHSALPGTLNYVEGQASIGSDTLNANSVGSATLANGQTLETGNGKAEILLTPGVFLRVDSNSAVQMISSSITNTEVRLDKGRAMVEVDELHDQNHLRVNVNGVETKLVKKGVYEFDADKQQVLVFDGKADVQDGDRTISVKGGHKLDLAGNGEVKSHSFNKDDYKQSDLYQWSSLRSSYLAGANVDAARVYVANGYYGPGWIGSGWYWAPGFGGYTYIPADGILYSPFGWGFYSPLVVYRSPLFFGYGGYGRGFYGYARPGFVNGYRYGPGFYRGPVVRNVPEFHGGPAFHSGGFGHGGFAGGGHVGGGNFVHSGGPGHGGFAGGGHVGGGMHR
jgi:FecR protein